MRVLIVEEDPAIVRFLKRGLAAHGYQAVTADNGHDEVLMAGR
jgi:DNA-binding response OmpR family regulator